MRIHVCPKCGGRHFGVTAHITQDWVVNSQGFWEKTTEDCVEVTHRPDDNDLWSCTRCGATYPGRELMTDVNDLRHLSAIVLVDKKWAIGKQGDQIVRLPSDLKRFKDLTTGHPIIVGRKTLATFPGGKPLKNRQNFLLTRGAGVEGAISCGDVQSVLDQVSDDAFVVGGSSVYEQFLPYCDTVYVTKVVLQDDAADSFFPNLDEDENWAVESESDVYFEDGLRFQYFTYIRK
jgi:dihydrofolate reductase